MNKIILLIGMGLLASCASALKKQCEATNWFDYGYKFAMTGKRLNSDTFVKQCEGEDVDVREDELDLGFKAGMQNYCKSDVVYLTGKNGELFNMDFCDPSQIKILQQKHKEGVQEYCKKDNGYPVGSSGKTYTQICPKDLEANFLKEYRRGRKVYLDQAILSKEQENVVLDKEASDLQFENSRKSSELMMLPPRRTAHFYQGMSATEHSNEQSRVDQENSRVDRLRQNIEWDMSGNNRKIINIREKQSEIRNQVFEMKKEKASIENQ